MDKEKTMWEKALEKMAFSFYNSSNDERLRMKKLFERLVNYGS